MKTKPYWVYKTQRPINLKAYVWYYAVFDDWFIRKNLHVLCPSSGNPGRYATARTAVEV